MYGLSVADFRGQAGHRTLADRPVMIWLTNGTHFVVGYGLKRGASRDNLQYDQVMVYNPDPQGAVEDGTLADMMKLNIWKDFGSIRRAFTD